MQLTRRTTQGYCCAYCRRSGPVRSFENGRDYCEPCGERVLLELHIRPLPSL